MPTTESALYAGMIGYAEHLEHQKAYSGNGHHLTQKLARLAHIDLLLMGDIGVKALAEEVEAAKTGRIGCPFCTESFPLAEIKGHVPQCSMR